MRTRAVVPSATPRTRILPPAVRGSRGVQHVLERNLLVYRHAWMVLFSGLVEPMFYLFAVGVGLGRLVGEVTGPDGEPVSYAAFVAPALLAASAMNGAVYEATFNIFFKLKYAKLYDAMLATPMRPGDIALGEVTWSQARGLLYATSFLVVMTAAGLVYSPWGVLAVPAAVLIGFAFGGVGIAATTFMRSWVDFDLVNLVLFPLFLFSATFYPLEVYPEPIQRLTQLSPLYHGVEIIRGLTLGMVGPSMLWHIGFLLVMGAAGLAVARRRFRRLLLP